MARRTPSWVLKRRYDQAVAREEYFSNRNTSDDTFTSTVVRSPRMRVGYRSLNQKTGATPAHALLSILASESAIKWFEGVAATGTLSNTNDRLGLKYADLGDYLQVENFEASKIHATIGGTTPTAKRTAWGTRYIKYTANAEGANQAHYTAPISVEAGDFTAADLRTAGGLIASVNAIKDAIGEYGRLWIEPESETFVIATE